MYIVIEGPDGSGKSSVVQHIAERLGDDCVVVREPGGTEFGEKLRELILSGNAIGRRAELLAMLAARAELIEKVVRPSLEAGKHVISDRGMASTYVFQCAQGGEFEMSLFDAFNKMVPKHQLFMLDVDYVTYLKRRPNSKADNIESRYSTEVAFNRMRDEYKMYANMVGMPSQRCYDTSGYDAQNVAQVAFDIITDAMSWEGLV